MTALKTHDHCVEAARFTKSRLLARLSLTTAFVVGMGINSAQAADQTTAKDDLDKAMRDASRAAEKFAHEAGEAIGDALESVKRTVRKLPQYEQPEMDDDGNIIIRRKPVEADGTEI